MDNWFNRLSRMSRWFMPPAMGIIMQITLVFQVSLRYTLAQINFFRLSDFDLNR